MIIGKDSAKIGFTWYAKTVLKLIAGVATISYIGAYPIVGVVGIIALLAFGYESFVEFKKLSNY